MKGHTTLVIGLNENREVGFIQTFDHETQRKEMFEAHDFVCKNFPIWCMGDVKRLKGIVEDCFDEEE